MNLLTVVSILSIVVVLGFLLFIYFDIKKIMKKKIYTEKEDVKMNTCPDFFELDGKRKEIFCKNIYKIGTGNDFNSSVEISKNISKQDEEKCDWARRNSVPWDGIDRMC